MASLEEAWRRKLAAGPTPVNPRQFLRLSMRYLRPHVRREAEVLVYMLLGLALTVVFPFAFRRLLDSAIPVAGSRRLLASSSCSVAPLPSRW